MGIQSQFNVFFLHRPFHDSSFLENIVTRLESVHIPCDDYYLRNRKAPSQERVGKLFLFLLSTPQHIMPMSYVRSQLGISIETRSVTRPWWKNFMRTCLFSCLVVACLFLSCLPRRAEEESAFFSSHPTTSRTEPNASRCRWNKIIILPDDDNVSRRVMSYNNNEK